MPPTPNLQPPDKVLVVDDDALIREMVSDLGFAEIGEEAQRQIDALRKAG